MHTLILLCTIAAGLLIVVRLLKAKKSAAHLSEKIKAIKTLEEALRDRDVVLVIQRMIREPLIEDPKNDREKRRNAKYKLLQARLMYLVPDGKVRKLIYNFIFVKGRR
tara:strand:+ start:316 stop:639 length:324 start_codon:yes stop_codon:yes gene_type:complete